MTHRTVSIKKTPRQYQIEQIDALREDQKTHKNTFCQNATGTGKTIIVANIVDMCLENAKTHRRKVRIGFQTPRLELIGQAEDHFYNHDIPYCLIDAKHKSSKAFDVNIISQQTLIRHIKKMLPEEIWDLYLIDEAHLAIKAQKIIVDICNEKRRSIGKPDMNIIGLSATPERADGIGLHKSGGGIYDSIVYGKSYPWYIAHGYLTQIEYFKPNPPAGLEKLGYTGTEVNTKQWDDWKKKNHIYGDIIDHYRKLGCVEKKSISLSGTPTIQINSHYHKGRPAVGFCHSVQEAYEMAEAFRNAGFSFQCIEGSMNYKARKMLNDALTRGELDGLTSCDLLLYGWNCPRIEYAFDMKKTRSFTYQMQKMGRGMRPYDERNEKENVIFRKEDFIFCDHVDNFLIHNIDGHLPQELDVIDWNFYGSEKKVRTPGNVLVNCPYLYKETIKVCSKKTCAGCKYLPAGKDAEKSRPDTIIINSDLIKHESKTAPIPVVIHDRKEFADQISEAINEYKADCVNINRPVVKLLKVAKDMNYNYMWVYYRLTEDSLAVCVPLLYEIGKQIGIKKIKGWAWYKSQEIKEHQKRKKCIDAGKKLHENRMMKWIYCTEKNICKQCKNICPDCNRPIVGDMTAHKQECHAEEFKLAAY